MDVNNFGNNSIRFWLLAMHLQDELACLRKSYAKAKRPAYMKPVRMFSSDDLPAPLGPMMAVNWPDRNSPETPFRMLFFSIKRTTKRFTVIERSSKFVIFGRKRVKMHENA